MKIHYNMIPHFPMHFSAHEADPNLTIVPDSSTSVKEEVEVEVGSTTMESDVNYGN